MNNNLKKLILKKNLMKIKINFKLIKNLLIFIRKFKKWHQLKKTIFKFSCKNNKINSKKKIMLL